LYRPTCHRSNPPPEVQLCKDVPRLHGFLVPPVRHPPVFELHLEARKGRVGRSLATGPCHGLVRNRRGYVCVPSGVSRFWASRSVLFNFPASNQNSFTAHSFSIILAKEQAPNPSSLGATNGIIQMSMSLARSISPAFADSAFAASVEGNILGGHMWVILLAGISCVGSLASARVVKDCARKY
jgi:hypothetical protein